MFEQSKIKSNRKREREGKGDPSDIEGYKGPWADYKDEVKVAKPTEVYILICTFMYTCTVVSEIICVTYVLYIVCMYVRMLCI